jgi:hypothetical protein
MEEKESLSFKRLDPKAHFETEGTAIDPDGPGGRHT